MQRVIAITLFLVLFLAIGMSFDFGDSQADIKASNISEVSVENMLDRLGAKKPNHAIGAFDEIKAKQGEDLIFNGYTTIDGKKSKRISTYFVCTDCHNTSREFKNLKSESAFDRLTYAEENGLPYLPGSTLWGIYNRTSFYNDDYVKKYGDLVVSARDTLENSVQLCAKYCSSGRYLESWELEAVMHYFKSTELKVKDLKLSESELEKASNYQALTNEEKNILRGKIEDSYRQSYSATFLKTMPREKRPYGQGGNPEKGQVIYKKACMFCHENKRVTYLHLDEGKLSGRFFWNNITTYNDRSLYQIIRYGTYSKAGRQQYMPRYTKEKMSDEQLNDLVAYIKQIAGK